MPVYEFECLNCQEITEAMQKMSDKPLETCEKCGGKLQKIISQTAFVLKGDGWFNSGYQKNGSKPEKKDASPAAPCATSGCSSPVTCKKN